MEENLSNTKGNNKILNIFAIILRRQAKYLCDTRLVLVANLDQVVKN